MTLILLGELLPYDIGHCPLSSRIASSLRLALKLRLPGAPVGADVCSMSKLANGSSAHFVNFFLRASSACANSNLFKDGGALAQVTS